MPSARSSRRRRGPEPTNAEGVTQQLANSSCGIGRVRVASVAIWSSYGTLLGSMRYVHSVVFGSSSQFNINVRGTTLSGGSLTSIGFADTVSEVGAGSSCWTGWHVQENNGGNDAFDSWNSKWDTAAINTGYTNNISANWIRRLTGVHTAAE